LVLPLFGCPAAVLLAIHDSLTLSDVNTIIEGSVETSLHLNMVLQLLDPIQVKLVKSFEE